jgi:hypothetical protein
VSIKHWTKLQQKSVKGIGIKPHNHDECLIILQCKQFLKWEQLQRGQSASKNFPYIDNITPQLTYLIKSPLYTRSASSLASPSSSLDEGQKREGGTNARDASHCKDDDVVVDAVVSMYKGLQ